MATPHEEHRRLGPRQVNFAIITVSTSRHRLQTEGKPYTDESGDLASSIIKGAGHNVALRLVVGDDESMIRRALDSLIHRPDVDVIVTIGGTGLAKTDVTIEAVRSILEKEIEGFGELFRYVSYSRVGAGAILSRATAGIANGKLIIALPGSPDGVRTGLELIMGEIPHILYVARG